MLYRHLNATLNINVQSTELSKMLNTKAIFYTSLALIAFAGNSILCRLALADGKIDPASFTNIRLSSGIIALLLLSYFSSKSSLSYGKQAAQNSAKQDVFSWSSIKLMPSLSAWYLFIYALGFSYAYVALDTGTGALILFGAVQLTLISFSFFKTKKITRNELLGLTLAFSGLIYLVYPSLTTPSVYAFVLMAGAGIAWGLYTISGQSSPKTQPPLLLTTNSFMQTLLMILLLAILNYQQQSFTTTGITLAIISGAITSGLGYYLWFIALKYISAIQAGVLQLLVPILASIGGVIFTNEIITLELTLATCLVLSGVIIVMFAKNNR
ncbi:DMT family transporter [Thalassotalea agariperforans]